METDDKAENSVDSSDIFEHPKHPYPIFLTEVKSPQDVKNSEEHLPQNFK